MQAQDGAAPTVDDSEARRAFESGRTAYDRGSFAEAVRWFEQAHALRPSPELLYNIGRAADSDGQASRAVTAYAAYLEAYPNATNRDFVRARLAKMRALERASAQPRDGSEQTSKSDHPPLPPVALTAQGPVREREHHDGAEPAPRFYKRAWFWTTVGLVIAGGVVATVLATRETAPERASADAYVFTPRTR